MQSDPPPPPQIDAEYLKSLGAKAAKAIEGAKGRVLDGMKAAAIERHHVFTIDYTDPRGGRWQGEFQNHVMTLGERETINLRRAHGLKGLSFEAVSPLTYNLLWMITHLDTTLDKRPDWAKELWDLFDPDLIEAIYREVMAHEARFCRAPQIARPGEAPASNEQPVA